MLGDFNKLFLIGQLPGDSKRVLTGRFSADTRHLGVSQANKNPARFR